MELASDVFIGLPLGGIYYFFVYKLMAVLFNKLPFTEKYQKNLLGMFIVAVTTIIVAQTVLKNQSYLKNHTLSVGLTFGGIMLLFYSVISNWNKMNDEIKVIIVGLGLGCIIWYCYSGKSKDIKLKKNKKNKIDVNDIEIDVDDFLTSLYE